MRSNPWEQNIFSSHIGQRDNRQKTGHPSFYEAKQALKLRSNLLVYIDNTIIEILKGFSFAFTKIFKL